jgi:hypothetical protein
VAVVEMGAVMAIVAVVSVVSIIKSQNANQIFQ